MKQWDWEERAMTVSEDEDEDDDCNYSEWTYSQFIQGGSWTIFVVWVWDDGMQKLFYMYIYIYTHINIIEGFEAGGEWFKKSI